MKHRYLVFYKTKSYEGHFEVDREKRIKTCEDLKEIETEATKHAGDDVIISWFKRTGFVWK